MFFLENNIYVLKNDLNATVNVYFTFKVIPQRIVQ